MKVGNYNIKINIIECGSIKHPVRDSKNNSLIGTMLSDKLIQNGRLISKAIRLNLKAKANSANTSSTSGSEILPVHAFLIEHPLGNVLIDTGVDDRIVGKLEELGFGPSDIDVISCSCFDADHTGGLKPLIKWCEGGEQPEAKCDKRTVPVAQKWDERTVPLSQNGENPANVTVTGGTPKMPRILLADEELYWMQRNQFKKTQPTENIEGVEHERFFFKACQDGPHHYKFDVFGDESVQLYLCTGHTFGTFATVVKNPKTGKFAVLASDIILDEDTFEESTVFHRGNQDKTLAWLRKMKDDPNCVAILPTHNTRKHITEFLI